MKVKGGRWLSKDKNGKSLGEKKPMGWDRPNEMGKEVQRMRATEHVKKSF